MSPFFASQAKRMYHQSSVKFVTNAQKTIIVDMVPSDSG